MRISHGIFKAFYLAFLIPIPLLPHHAQADTKSSNAIIHQGNRLVMKTVVPYYDNENNTIIVDLFPYDLTDEEINRVKKDEAFFVIINKKSPGAHWNQPVYATLEIKLSNTGKAGSGIESIEYLKWSFTWFKAKNSSAMTRLYRKELDPNRLTDFTYSLTEKRTISLKFKGSDTIGDQTYAWDINFNTILHMKKK